MAEDEQKLLILNQENLSLKSTIDQLTHRITELEASLLAASRPSSPIKFLKIDEEKRSISPFQIVENQAEEDKEVIQKLERANDIILKKDREIKRLKGIIQTQNSKTVLLIEQENTIKMKLAKRLDALILENNELKEQMAKN